MTHVNRLAHVVFSTQDLAQQVDYWSQVMGLTIVDRSATRAVLATSLGQECVTLEAGDLADLRRVGFQIASADDLEIIQKRLKAVGVPFHRRSDVSFGLKDTLCFNDPKGTVVEVFTESVFHPQEKFGHGIDPLKLGHVASRVRDPRKVSEFYQDILGFRVSDWVGDHFVFMRCGVDHHTVNFAQFDQERLHHVAFEVKDWAHIQSSCEILARNEHQLVWGPLRHIVGHNIAAYHRNPDDLRVECYCEMDQMKDEALGYWEPRPWHDEIPLRPRVWPKDTWRSAWGFGSFGTFPGYP